MAKTWELNDFAMIFAKIPIIKLSKMDREEDESKERMKEPIAL